VLRGKWFSSKLKDIFMKNKKFKIVASNTYQVSGYYGYYTDTIIVDTDGNLFSIADEEIDRCAGGVSFSDIFIKNSDGTISINIDSIIKLADVDDDDDDFDITDIVKSCKVTKWIHDYKLVDDSVFVNDINWDRFVAYHKAKIAFMDGFK
jgi:hypothetical protein